MTRCGKAKRPFSMAERIGVGALGAALAMAVVDLRWAVLPLGIFLLLCAVAPFVPGVGFFLPVISRGRAGQKAVALTFDDGPDPVSTPRLLDLLTRHGVVATFFVTGRRATRHPEVIRQILSQGHTIGNHTYGHDNFIMLKRCAVLKREILAAQDVLSRFGIAPIAFRPPVGVTSPRLAPVMRELGMLTVNFSRRAGDRGNRRVEGIASRILNRLCAGDIILLHDTHPHNTALFDRWLEEIEKVLTGIRAKGLTVIPLSTLIDRPVMVVAEEKSDS